MVDLSDGANELLQEVATDGGTHYTEAADDLGVSTSSIYRWLSELGDLVRNENGELSLVSQKLEREVAAIAERAEQAVTAGAERICRLVNQQRDGSESALQRWMNTYGVEIDDGRGDQEGRIRIDELLSELRWTDQPRISDVLEEGRSAWQRAGLDVARFDAMRIEASLAMNGDARGRARKWIG
jgi:transposase